MFLLVGFICSDIGGQKKRSAKTLKPLHTRQKRLFSSMVFAGKFLLVKGIPLFKWKVLSGDPHPPQGLSADVRRKHLIDEIKGGCISK
jgi:hypothetical protein